MLRTASLALLAAGAVASDMCNKDYSQLDIQGNRGTASNQPFDYYQYTWQNPPATEDFPNGFRSAQIYHENSPPFCLNVRGTANTMVKVIVEGDAPDARLCIASQDYDPMSPNPSALMPRCDNGQVSACFPADVGQDFNLMIFCQGGCAEGDTGFRYKVFHSQRRNQINTANSATENIDMWCMMIDGTGQNDSPKEIANDLNNDVYIPSYEDPTNAAGMAGPGMLGVAAGAAVMMAF